MVKVIGSWLARENWRLGIDQFFQASASSLRAGNCRQRVRFSRGKCSTAGRMTRSTGN
jgi:hypothetical protein